MLTKNFMSCLTTFPTKYTAQVRLTNGNTSTIYAGSSSNHLALYQYLFRTVTTIIEVADGTTMTGDSTEAAFAFGTGSLPPSYDDYCLSGDYVPGITIIKNRPMHDCKSPSSCCFKNELTIRNDGSDTVIIKEVGRVMSSYLTSSSSSDSTILLDRVVLDSPLTLAPGESGVITLTVNIPIA